MKVTLGRPGLTIRRAFRSPYLVGFFFVLVIAWDAIFAAWDYASGDRLQIAIMFTCLGSIVTSAGAVTVSKVSEWRAKKRWMEAELQLILHLDGMRWRPGEEGADNDNGI